MIEIRNLRKVIKKKVILDLPHLVFSTGKVTGIVGKNGSGKSTLLRIILDLERASSGEVLIDDVSNTANESWKKKTGAYLDEDFLIDFLYPEEYFELLLKLRGASEKHYSDLIGMLESFFAGEILLQNKLIGTFSKGNRQKIGIAGALIGNATTVILDEPLSNLDQDSQRELLSILKLVNAGRKASIIMTTHDLSLIHNLFDNVVTLHDGKVVETEARLESVN